jgi:hypothetical protein
MAQINLSGSVGVPGSAAILGSYNVIFTSTDNTNGYHLMSPAEYSNVFINVTSAVSLGATKNLIAVFNSGQMFVIQNNTTGGQAIQVIATNGGGGGGTTGTGVTIPNGATVSVICDGTKYLTTAGGAVTVGGDLSGTTTSATVIQAQGGDIVFSPNSVAFASTVASPVILQTTTSSGSGQQLVIAAQSTSAISPATGGGLILSSGTGTTTALAGNLSLDTGLTSRLSINGATGTITIPAFTAGIVHSDGSGDLSSSAIVNSDIAGAAAIAVSKLAPGTSAQILINSATPTPTWASVTGDITLSNTGLATVIALQGNAVEAQSLGINQDGYVLAWKNSATQWQATPISTGSTSLAGDVTGLSTSNTVGKIQNEPVATTPPTITGGQYGSVLIWNGSQYAVRNLTQDDIAPGFTINSFGASQVVEVGAQIVAPVLTASYNATPASATVTNTDGFNSPYTLANPYTSTGSAYSTTTFQHNTVNAVTSFTLSATSVNGVVKTAGASFEWEARMFIGTGAAGSAATATATAGNTATLGNGSVLANQGLFSTAQGQVFPVTASGNKIYLLITGLYTSFTDLVANQPFAFNAGQSLTFINQQGAHVSMYLYESTNTLTASFQIRPNS